MNIIRKLNDYTEFDKVFSIMLDSFPKTELRAYEGQKSLLKNNSYNLYVYEFEKTIVAFISVWEFDKFLFVEHFAVLSNLRGKKIGKTILKQVIEKYDRCIILEVEPPKDDFSKKRIKFYENIGFYINDYEYFQPKLQEDNPVIPLKIMSYPKSLANEEFLYAKEKIYKQVYKMGDE